MIKESHQKYLFTYKSVLNISFFEYKVFSLVDGYY